MPVKKLFYLLTRQEITEVALQSGRPPCALVNGAYRRISSDLLSEDEIITMLAAAGGHEHLAGLADGRTWDHQASVGTIRVMAAYDGPQLKASMRLVAPAEPAKVAPSPAPVAPTAAAPAPAAPAPAPTRAARPAASPVISGWTPAAAPLPTPAARAEFAAPERAPQPSAARKAQPVADPGDADRSFGEAAADAEFAALPPMPPVRAQSVKVVTAHDAFNFEPATGWSRPPEGVGNSQPAPARTAERRPAKPKFAGDLLDDLLGSAREQHASDVHVVAARQPLFRIAGDLVPQGEAISEQEVESLLMARVPDTLHATLAQHGSCDFSLIHPAYGRFRANVCRQRTGFKLTARPIGETIPTLSELGLPEAIARAVHHHQGLIVITGTTGHGKTTTLAAIVGIINRETSHHVITVEDPIEYVHPIARAVISQREVGTHTKSFQAALKGSLREDPDVIVVGELRDTETVRMALTASETGHLVISTMNTPSAAKAIERLIDLFPPGDQPQVRMTLAGGLRLIISQRLVPSTDGKRLHAAAEVLPGMLPLWNLIRENRTYQIASLMQRGKSLGIVRLDESLAELVRSGKVSLETARQAADAPEHLDALIAGRAIPVKPDEQAGLAGKPGATLSGVQNPNKTAGAATAAAAQKGKEIGKQVLSRAGKLFGNNDG